MFSRLLLFFYASVITLLFNMPTDPTLSCGHFQSEAHRLPGTRARRTRATTLVEVMVASIIFTLTAVSIGTLFVQNNKMSTLLRYRTNATNAALNILEQLRVLDFDSLNNVYLASAPNTVTGAYIRVIVADPNAPDYSANHPEPLDTVNPGFGVDPVPASYQKIDVLLNVRDAVVKNNTTWSLYPNGGLPMANATSISRMPLRFWLTLKYNETVSGSSTITTAKGQAFEIILVYQWQQPGSSTWQSGTVRAVVPNPSPTVIRS